MINVAALFKNKSPRGADRVAAISRSHCVRARVMNAPANTYESRILSRQKERVEGGKGEEEEEARNPHGTRGGFPRRADARGRSFQRVSN